MSDAFEQTSAGNELPHRARSVQIAQDKAYTAANFGMSTDVVKARLTASGASEDGHRADRDLSCSRKAATRSSANLLCETGNQQVASVTWPRIGSSSSKMVARSRFRSRTC